MLVFSSFVMYDGEIICKIALHGTKDKIPYPSE